MILKKWFSKTVNETVEDVIEPAKQIIKSKAQKVGDQTNLITKLILLGGAICIVWSAFSKNDSCSDDSAKSSHIVINNYLYREEDEDDDD